MTQDAGLSVMVNCSSGDPDDERRHPGIYAAASATELASVPGVQPMPRLLETARGRALALKSMVRANATRRIAQPARSHSRSQAKVHARRPDRVEHAAPLDPVAEAYQLRGSQTDYERVKRAPSPAAEWLVLQREVAASRHRQHSA
jgi:hypothetical protein